MHVYERLCEGLHQKLFVKKAKSADIHKIGAEEVTRYAVICGLNRLLKYLADAPD